MKFIKHIFFILITFCVSNLFSQTNPVAIGNDKYPFINYNVNHLYFSNDSSAFLKLYKKMGELSTNSKKNKVITIAHIGGSHVQGGAWSNSFLTNLQNEFITTGGGFFVFPYKIAKTNSQPYSSSFTNGDWKKCRCITKGFCLPLGMNGMSIKTNDSVNHFGVTLTKKGVCKSFNTVKVYHNFNRNFYFNILKKYNLKAEVVEKKELGYTEFNLEMPVDSVSFELIRLDSMQKDFIVYGFSLENNLSSGFYLAGLGANGASSNSFLKCTYFEEQLKSIHPDLVIISLGVNDTQAKDFEKEEFIEHYDSLIMAIKKAKPDVAILLTTTTDNFIRRKTANKRSLTAHDAMFELMEKHHVAVWDMYEFMGGFKSMMKWTKVGLGAKDRVHFSPKGYTMLGYYMFEAFIKSYYNNKKK